MISAEIRNYILSESLSEKNYNARCREYERCKQELMKHFEMSSGEYESAMKLLTERLGI